MPHTPEGVGFVKGSDTSEQAAQHVAKRVETLRLRVFRAIQLCSGANEPEAKLGMTCDEVEHALEMSHQTASARIHDLAKQERIFDSGLRRKTRSGRNAVVWIAPTDVA